MRNPKKANKDPDVARISAALFKFNRRFRNYLVDSGLEVGDRGTRVRFKRIATSFTAC